MFAGYYFIYGVVAHLPLLAVLVTGLVLVARQRARIGARSVTLAQLGLGLLTLELVAEAAWTMALPQLYQVLDSAATSFGVVSSAIGLILSVLLAAGIGLLIAAVVARTSPGSDFAGAPGPVYGGPPGYPPASYSPGQPADSYVRPDNPATGPTDPGFNQPT